MKKLFLIFLVLFYSPRVIFAQIVHTIAGIGVGGFSGDGGPATAAELHKPNDFVFDLAGNIIFSDVKNNRIREISTTGIITTVVGNGVGSYSGDGGPATAAEIDSCHGVWVDGIGNIFVADLKNNRIRVVTQSTGIITTIAGNGVGGYNGDGGPATAAEINHPYGVYVDGVGNVYLADANNHCVRMVNYSTGIITTVAGNGVRGYTGDGGPATAAELSEPRRFIEDVSGDLLISDANKNCIREVNHSTGIITTIAGTGRAGYSGNGGPATLAELNDPVGISYDLSGNLLISDSQNNCIRQVSPSGTITTIAGNTITGFSGDGGPPLNAEFNTPRQASMNSQGNIYITDLANNRIREITKPLTVKDTLIKNITCYGENSGSASAIASGGIPPYTYLWNPGGQTTSNATGLSTGTYTITVSDGFDTPVKDSVTITQPTPIIASTTTTPNSCGNQDGTATVTANGGTPPYAYQWSGNNGTNATAVGLGTDTYTVTITDANGCTGSATAIITQPGQVVVGLSADLNQGCSPLCIQFRNTSTGNSSGSQSYLWSFGDGDTSNSQNPIHCYLSGGQYSIGLTVISGGGCSSSLKIVNLITVFSRPQAAFSVYPQPTDILSPTIHFTSQTSDSYGIVQWAWTFGDRFDSINTLQNPVHTYLDTGRYCAQLVVTDKNGCMDTATNCLVISPLFTLYIPDAFSPNGDGINDEFKVKGKYVKNFEMEIFDRWGQEIFQSNDINIGWNGKVNGGSTVCQAGTYAYNIIVTDSQNKQHTYIGSVAILR